jgi:molybdopterin/thiamine biosynthesis adenylyltransferase
MEMTGLPDRFDRNVRLFGHEGQRTLRDTHVTVVGVGGLGTHVIQQLALLGVGKISCVDHEQISTTNKNRYIGIRHDDPIPGTLKVDVANRLIESIDPCIQVSCIARNVVSEKAFNAIKDADYVFGCVDHDGARFVINDVATAYARPYIDLATDVVGRSFGGRVVFKSSPFGCLYCFGELDQKAVQQFFETPSDKAARLTIYGVDQSLLDDAGPSVVSVNGVITSLAVTEFMVACTGMALPKRFINYDGSKARALERVVTGHPDCPYCRQWGHGQHADTDRYLRFECHLTRCESANSPAA